VGVVAVQKRDANWPAGQVSQVRQTVFAVAVQGDTTALRPGTQTWQFAQMVLKKAVQRCCRNCVALHTRQGSQRVLLVSEQGWITTLLAGQPVHSMH
jgi:hypothetical protein